MMNLSIINILSTPAADVYIKLKNVISKLHNKLVGIAFIKKLYLLM